MIVCPFHEAVIFCLLVSCCAEEGKSNEGSSRPEQSRPLDLEIVSVIPYNVPVGPALPVAGAALHMSVENVRSVYSRDLNINLTLLYKASDRLCDSSDANAPLLLAEYYNTEALNRCVVVIAAACGGLGSVPFLTKEWNILLFSNSLVSTEVFDSINAPTSVAMAGSYEGLAIALLRLFAYFKWWHFTMLLDTTAASECYRMTMQAMFHILAADGTDHSGFYVDKYTFLPTDAQSMREAIAAANLRSRVFLVLGHTKVVIKLLRLARDSKLINNTVEYVFVIIQPLPVALYGAPSLFADPHAEDINLFRSVLYLTTYGGAPVNGSARLNDALARKQKADYGTVLEKGIEPLDLYSIRDTYSSVELFAQLVNESRALPHNGSLPDDQVCSGRKLRTLTVQRTFNFQSGVVHFDRDGLRFADLIMFSFQPGNKAMEITARYDSASQLYSWDANFTMNWLMGRPPLDIPVCGFSGFEASCAIIELPATLITSLVLPAVLTVTVVILVASFFGWWRHCVKKEIYWWYLSRNNLDLREFRRHTQHL